MPKAELYKISVVEGKVLVRVPPQLVGAQTASLDDIQADLHLMDVDYIPEKLLEIYERTSGEFDYLCDEESKDFTLQIELTKDESAVYLNIVPPKIEEEPLTEERIYAALKEKGIYQGVLEENIQKMISEKIYYEPTMIACGRIPVNGKDGYAEILFLPESERPAPGSQFNLREIPMLQEVKAGDELIKMIPSTAGEDGFTITGKVIGATAGREFKIFPGRNTRFNEERTHIIATSDGVLCQLGEYLSVEEVHVVDKVDASTGHVRFDGVIKVRGNISDRYSVEGVRIEVGGTVGKARLRSIGDIRVAQGIMGSMIQAGGSVLAQTITDAQVNAAENVVVYDYIINSKVNAGNNLDIPTHHGYAHGGTLQAGNLIRLPKVGPPEEFTKEEDEVEELPTTTTMLEVGISLASRKQFNTLLENIQNNFNEFEDSLKEILPVFEKSIEEGLSPEDLDALNEAGEEASKKSRMIFLDNKKIRLQREINHLNETVNGGIVFITGGIQPGTAINVRRMRYNVLTPTTSMAYHFSQNGVQSAACETMIDDYRKYLLKLPA